MSEPRDQGLYGLLYPEGPPHEFDDEGLCIHCGTDAESWDLDCDDDEWGGWFWKKNRGYWYVLHLKGPVEGWSLCGRARIGHPAHHPYKNHGIEWGSKCDACKRLAPKPDAIQEGE